MASLQAQMAASAVSLSVVYSASELSSGLQQAPASVQAVDMAPVASTDAAAGLVIIRTAFAAGAGGAADDITVYAVNTLPFKFRVIDAWALVGTAVAASTLAVRTAAAGAGTLLASIGSAATGRNGLAVSVTATAVATPGASAGLFVRRSDNGVAGEVYVLARIES